MLIKVSKKQIKDIFFPTFFTNTHASILFIYTKEKPKLILITVTGPE